MFYVLAFGCAVSALAVIFARRLAVAAAAFAVTAFFVSALLELSGFSTVAGLVLFLGGVTAGTVLLWSRKLETKVSGRNSNETRLAALAVCSVTLYALISIISEGPLNAAQNQPFADAAADIIVKYRAAAMASGLTLFAAAAGCIALLKKPEGKA